MRRSRRRFSKRSSNSGSLEINLAAMLDMAFQLLAFFVLTFRPSSVEGHFQVFLPPPTPVTNVEASAVTDGAARQAAQLENLEKLRLFVTSDDAGFVSEVRIGTRSVIRGPLSPEVLAGISGTLREMLSDESIPFTSIQCHADSQLHYGELMQIVGVCTQQVLANGESPKLNLVETETGPSSTTAE